jgi:uncharacterized protein
MKIAYVDSSVVVRYYLVNDPHHAEAVTLIDDTDGAVVTGTWTVIETSGALVRACRGAGVEATAILARFDLDVTEGPITLVAEPQDDVERIAHDIVRTEGIRAMDAWHIAVASLALPELAGPGDQAVFVTRDGDQARAAERRGLTIQWTQARSPV